MWSTSTLSGWRVIGVAVASLVVAMTVAVGPAAATTFTSSTAISIPTGGAGAAGKATPYPSSIMVSGLTGVITDVNISLMGLTHTNPFDIDVLLVGPSGKKALIMSSVGADFDVSGINVTFDDAATSQAPKYEALTAGTWRPASHGAGPTFEPPAPAGPYMTLLSTFNGVSPNSTWDLYVYDGVATQGGSISGGWSLDITTDGHTIESFAPTSGGPGTSVVISGTKFTGATAVSFGGVSAAFMVNSPTTITATVPAGAITGPIAVTTPAGTATSASSFSVTPASTITSMSPRAGEVGDAVEITGTAFTDATAVSFNSIPTSEFTVDSPTQITATVPPGAGTGPISVTTPSGAGTSTIDFVVRHNRNLSLTMTARKGRGTVNVTDGFTPCRSGIPVKLQRRRGDKWRTVGSTLTTGAGNYSLAGASRPGRYRAVAKATTLASGDVCLKDISPVDRK